MRGRREGEVGSPTWVRDRLRALPADDSWTRTNACRDLISWLYPVAMHRAGMAGVPTSDRAEVAQDAMPRIISALKRSRARFARAGNPAALLERVTARAVSGGVHRMRMAGLGGVPPNGRHWRTPYARTLGGDLAQEILIALPSDADQPSFEVDDAAARIGTWVTVHLGVYLTADAVHAVTYALDRLVAGVSRGALARGGYVGLGDDPAMRHLGFTPQTSRVLARWLLGRTDRSRGFPSVLNAALLDEEVGSEVLAAWRRTAIEAGFAHDQNSAVTRLDDRSTIPARRIA